MYSEQAICYRFYPVLKPYCQSIIQSNFPETFCFILDLCPNLPEIFIAIICQAQATKATCEQSQVVTLLLVTQIRLCGFGRGDPQVFLWRYNHSKLDLCLLPPSSLAGNSPITFRLGLNRSILTYLPNTVANPHTCTHYYIPKVLLLHTIFTCDLEIKCHILLAMQTQECTFASPIRCYFEYDKMDCNLTL